MFSNQKNQVQEKWRWELDNFVDDHKDRLSALAWGLQQEWKDGNSILGIDLKPQPHFVSCDRESLENLNKNTKGRLQEILGLIDGYETEKEVLIIVIGEGQVKLIHFQPEITPPDSFKAENQDIDRLIKELETALGEKDFFEN
ncbi:MAG: hypothetical protein QNJ60_12390 [Xenococcaceae cyanobacterium MO_188.B19]|nr:hypothetical protein [Xenococcaceae cyanobacterium MO_188.B19]